jgi:hypothetical protein
MTIATDSVTPSSHPIIYIKAIMDAKIPPMVSTEYSEMTMLNVVKTSTKKANTILKIMPYTAFI